MTGATLLDYQPAGIPNSSPPPGGWNDPSGNWSVLSGLLKRTGSGVWYGTPLYRSESVRNGKIVAVTGPVNAGPGQGVIARCSSGLTYYFAYADTTNLYFFVVTAGASAAQIGALQSWAPITGHAYVFEFTVTSADGTHSNLTLNLYDAASVYVDPVTGNVLVSAGAVLAAPLATNTVAGDTTGPQSAGGWGVNRAGSLDPGWSRAVTRTFDNDSIIPTDANFFTSPYNWDLTGASSAGYVLSQNAGAYLKTQFTGSSLGVVLDFADLLGAATASNAYPLVYYSIDDGPIYTAAGIWAASGNGGAFQVGAATTILLLASGLPAGTHSLEFGIAATGSADRWTTPVNAVRIRGLLVDAGATSATPVLYPGRALIHGDSISEGVRARGLASTADATYNVFASDALHAFGRALGLSLQCEYGIVAYGSQGYTAAGAGNVPAHPSAWNYLHNGVSRLVNGLYSPPPTYIVDTLGTNDAGASAGAIAPLISAQLASYRAAAPHAVIVKTVPWGGFSRAGITVGYGTYRSTAADANCLLLDFGMLAEQGLSGGSASLESYDGLHLSSMSHSRAASEIAGGVAAGALARILSVLLPTAGGGPYAINHDGGTGASGSPDTVAGVSAAADCLRVVDTNGAGIAGATVRLYLGTDAAFSNALGAATTGPDGRWLAPIYCGSGSYQLVTTAAGEQANVVSVVVP